MILNTKELIGINQVNSVDYVKFVFQVYNSGNVLVILKQSSSEFNLKEEKTPNSGGGWMDFKQAVIQESRPAQIVFTSGTEGASKAILLSHQSLADVVIRLNKIMKVDETIREYIGIPVTYSFGLGRCRAVAAVGGRCFIPENGFNPAELARMLASNEINAFSAVPTLCRTLMGQPEIIGALGSKVKWIEIGSQYMSREEKGKMKALFPNAIIVQHYGLTEASRTTFLNISETKSDLLESVGQTTGDVEVKTSPEGLILIRRPHVASGQIVDGNIRELTDKDGWYTTGDLGRIEDGYLYYEGRADDQINCGGVKVNPDLLQERINRRLNIENTIAVCRIDDELRGDGFFVAFEDGYGIKIVEVQEAVIDELLVLGVNAKSSVKIQQVKKIPRTDTGKIQRKELSKLYSKKIITNNMQSIPDASLSIHESFARIFPGVDIKPDDTFQSLGGDSLNYIQMLMLLESRFGFVPTDWDKMAIERLEKIEIKNNSSMLSWIEASIFLRVIAILGVVATHSGVSAMGGGTLLLFALIGYNMGRFKSKEFFEGNIWPWIKSFSIIILIPYYALVVASTLVWRKSFEVDALLLYANLVNARITVLFPFWFVQVLLQCLIIFGLIFSLPSLRRYASTSPVIFSFSMLVFLITIRAIYPVFWDTSHLNDLVPLRFMAILWLGWSFYFVESFWQKLLLCAIGIGFAFLDTKLSGVTSWLVIGSVFLAFIPRVPIPSFAKKAFNDIGAATFYVFIYNGVIIWILIRMNHILHIDSKVIIFFTSFLGSMFLWWAMERLKLISMIQSLINSRS